MFLVNFEEGTTNETTINNEKSILTERKSNLTFEFNRSETKSMIFDLNSQCLNKISTAESYSPKTPLNKERKTTSRKSKSRRSVSIIDLKKGEEDYKNKIETETEKRKNLVTDKSPKKQNLNSKSPIKLRRNTSKVTFRSREGIIPSVKFKSQVVEVVVDKPKKRPISAVTRLCKSPSNKTSKSSATKSPNKKMAKQVVRRTRSVRNATYSGQVVKKVNLEISKQEKRTGPNDVSNSKSKKTVSFKPRKTYKMSDKRSNLMKNAEDSSNDISEIKNKIVREVYVKKKTTKSKR